MVLKDGRRRESRSGGGWRDRDLRGGGPDSGKEPGAKAVRRGVPPVPRRRRLLGLTAGPESQRSGGGLTILPREPVPSNRHRPRCGSAGGSSLTFPAGGASARCPGPGGGGVDEVGRGGRERGRLNPQRQQKKEGGGVGAVGAGASAARAPFGTRGGSPSIPLSLSYCQYHRAAESMAHAQPNLLASSTRP